MDVPKSGKMINKYGSALILLIWEEVLEPNIKVLLSGDELINRDKFTRLCSFPNKTLVPLFFFAQLQKNQHKLGKRFNNFTWLHLETYETNANKAMVQNHELSFHPAASQN